MKSKKYYHATSNVNFESIVSEKVIRAGCDGLVYLAESAQEALRFVCIRYRLDDIVVLEVELPADKVFETFDHSFAFFKCRAFGYMGDIPFSKITDAMKFEKKL